MFNTNTNNTFQSKTIPNIDNTGGNNLFGNNTGNSANPGLFKNDAQQQQQRNMFGNTTPTFGNNSGNPFNNNSNNSTPMFGNGNQGNQGNTMFNNSNTGAMFGNTGTNNNTGGTMFNTSNTGNTGGNMFGNNANSGGNMFSNTGANAGTMFNTGGSMFNNQGSNPQVGSGNNPAFNLFNRPNTQGNTGSMGTMGTNNNSYYFNEALAFQNSLANIKLSLEQCVNRISSRNLEGIRLDSWNIFKDKQLNKIPLKN